MQPQQLQSILELLATIQEGLQYLQQQQDLSVKQAVAEGRQAVTHEVEKLLGDTLDHRITADVLSDYDWFCIMQRIVEQLMNPFQPQNLFDNKFMEIMRFVWIQDEKNCCSGNLIPTEFVLLCRPKEKRESLVLEEKSGRSEPNV